VREQDRRVDGALGARPVSASRRCRGSCRTAPHVRACAARSRPAPARRDQPCDVHDPAHIRSSPKRSGSADASSTPPSPGRSSEPITVTITPTAAWLTVEHRPPSYGARVAGSSAPAGRDDQDTARARAKGNVHGLGARRHPHEHTLEWIPGAVLGLQSVRLGAIGDELSSGHQAKRHACSDLASWPRLAVVSRWPSDTAAWRGCVGDKRGVRP
jgi:hypothetical protein